MLTILGNEAIAENAPERQPRKPHRNESKAGDADPLKVIDGDKADIAEAAKPDAPADNAPKPRRRRTYKKREEAEKVDTEAAAPIEDGVMKTLSRGRKKPAVAKTETTPEGDTPVEAAE